MGIAHYLRHSHFNAVQVFEQSKAQCSGEGIKKVFMRLCSLCELRWLWLKQQQQRAAGVKSCAARMSVPACQELICAPVFWISKKTPPTWSSQWRDKERCEMLINCPVCRWLQEQGDNLSISFVCESEKVKQINKKRSLSSSWSCLWNQIPPLPRVLPLWYNLVGIGEVAVDVLHLERVSVTDLVVSPAIVGRLDHNDITPRAAEINCISFAWELSPDQPERQGRTAEPWRRRQRRKTLGK